jgi:O-antigen/teichoic acid export membrane protein
MEVSRTASILFAVPVIVLIFSLSQILIPLLLRREKIGTIAVSRVLYSGADTGVSAGVGMWGFNTPYALLLGRVSGLAVQFVALISGRGPGRRGGVFSKESVKRLSQVSGRYKDFPKFVWSPLLQRLGNQLPVLILSAYFSSAVVGYFAFSRRILYEPIEVVGNGIARSYFQKSSKMHREGHDLSIVSKRMFQVLAAVVTLPMMLLGIIGDDIFFLFFGSDWQEAGVYTQLLVPMYIATFFFRPISCLFDVLERQKDAFYFNLAFVLITVAAVYSGCMAGNPLLSIGLFSLAATVLIASRMVWLLCLIGVKAGKTVYIILKNILISIFFALPVFLLKYSAYSAPVGNTASAAIMAGLYYLFIINVDENVYMEFRRGFPSKPSMQKMITILRFGRPCTPC